MSHRATSHLTGSLTKLSLSFSSYYLPAQWPKSCFKGKATLFVERIEEEEGNSKCLTKGTKTQGDITHISNMSKTQ